MENLLLMLLQQIVVPATDHLQENELVAIERSLIPSSDSEEILWLARILYSETKDAHEMKRIAWVVRNRVETNFRGSTYEEVALAKNQFSGLHKSDPHYRHNISRTYTSKQIAWLEALSVAEEVFYAPDSARPFPVTVRHFYSPVAVSAPGWVEDGELHHEVIDLKGNVRFAFYDGVR
jgi:hypothetical protein